MLIVIFGESCTGKSTLAAQLKAVLQAECCSGKDYLRLAKKQFQKNSAYPAGYALRFFSQRR